MNKNIIAVAVIAFLIGAGGTYAVMRPFSTNPTSMMRPPSASSLMDNPQMNMPVINAYYGGREIWFMHTDVSDKQMAGMLSTMVNMMGNGHPTIHSPKLGDVPGGAAGKLYVFTNGVSQEGAKPWGGGPFGYQIDVFDSTPDQSEYTPLRTPRLVAWKDGAEPRVLTSVDEILAAEEGGELTVQETDVIVNAPIVKW